MVVDNGAHIHKFCYEVEKCRKLGWIHGKEIRDQMRLRHFGLLVNQMQRI